MPAAILRLQVVRGDAEQVLSAALASLAERAVEAQEDATISAQAIDTGEYLDSWEALPVRQLETSIINDASPPDGGESYASYVHARPKYGGPPGLGERVFREIADDIESSGGEIIEDRIRELFA